jgi:hypothetical protein
MPPLEFNCLLCGAIRTPAPSCSLCPARGLGYGRGFRGDRASDEVAIIGQNRIVDIWRGLKLTGTIKMGERKRAPV